MEPGLLLGHLPVMVPTSTKFTISERSLCMTLMEQVGLKKVLIFLVPIPVIKWENLSHFQVTELILLLLRLSLIQNLKEILEK